MTRSIIRHVDWTCATEPASPHPVHVFECTTCGEHGEADDLFEHARDFVFQHVSRNPSHTGFRETVTRHWRMYGSDVDQPPALVDEPPARSGATPCPECRGRGLRVLPASSAETECSACEGTGHARGGPASTPTWEYGAPYIPPMSMGAVDSGSPEQAERY